MLCFFSPSSIADIETDKKVGLCMSYLTLTQSLVAREDAAKMADNQDRAIQFAKTELDKVARWNKAGKWDQNMQQGYALSGNSACRAIGIRPADYKK